MATAGARSLSYGLGQTLLSFLLHIGIWIVLLVNDADVVFCCFFIYELAKIGGHFYFLLAVMFVGIFTYLLGVCVFGPRQKFKIIELVQDTMVQSGEGLWSDNAWKHTGEGATGAESIFKGVGIDSHLDPKATGGPTFADLRLDEQGINDCCEALQKWGLSEFWKKCDIKTYRNTCRRRHGIPLWRLGYFLLNHPEAADVCGIFNAMSLYLNSMGVSRLAIGAAVYFTIENPSFWLIYPPVTSGLTLALLVICYRCIGSEEFETRLFEDDTHRKCEVWYAKEKKQLDEWLQKEKSKHPETPAATARQSWLLNMVSVFSGDPNDDQTLTAGNRLEKLYHEKDQKIREFAGKFKKIDMRNYYHYVTGGKRAMSLRARNERRLREETHKFLQTYEGFVCKFNDLKENKINVLRGTQEQISGIDPTTMQVAQYEAQLKQILQSEATELKRIDKELKDVTKTFVSNRPETFQVRTQ